jgi:hypothetical protein
MKLVGLLAVLAVGWAATAGVVLAVPTISNVPETEGWDLVYTLPIPNTAGFRNSTAVPYSVDNSGAIGYFDRVGYYLELDTGTGPQWVYASMDAFTGDRSKIGLPHNVDNPVIWQQTVSNMNVASNKPGIVTGTGIATGNVEMWSTNYNQGNAIGIPGASGSAFDFGDGGAGIGAGHGSFQVHNYGAGQTLIGYSDWGGNSPSANSELGIGTNTGTVVTPGGPVGVGGHPDWTFADSAHLYTAKKELQIVVRPAGIPTAPTNIVANAPEASTFTVVYDLPIQNGAFNPSQYAVDAAGAYPDGSFGRVAYYLELDHPTFGPQFVYVSMDPFAADADQLGVPKAITNTANAIEQLLGNMNVISDVTGVVNGTGIGTGNIEFWGTNYTGAANDGIGGAGSYDFDDTPTPGGHGSMQIHNYGAGQTIFAYNNWNSGSPALGIGNSPSGNPDWTFNNISNNYTTKHLWVLAEIDGASLDTNFGTEVDFGVELQPFETATIAAELQNIGVTNSIIDVYNYSITGADPGFFALSGFAPTLLQAGWGDTMGFDVEFLGGLNRSYSAQLTFTDHGGNTVATYDLAAFVVPEPGTLLVWSLLATLGITLGWRRRRR